MIKNTRYSKRSIAMAAIFIVLTILLLLLSRVNKNESSFGENREYSDPNGPALILDSSELYQKINDDYAYQTIKTNLAFFARDTIDAYKPPYPGDIVYTVKKYASKNDKTVVFEGTFEKSSDKIVVEFEKLNNGKVKLSITNMATGQNINDRLPANSVLDSFIGSLPYQNNRFLIEYNKSSGSFTVTALVGDSSVKQESYDYISKGTNTSLDALKIVFVPLPNYDLQRFVEE